MTALVAGVHHPVVYDDSNDGLVRFNWAGPVPACQCGAFLTETGEADTRRVRSMAGKWAGEFVLLCACCPREIPVQ